MAIEPGAGLADLLRRKVEGSSAEVLTSTFEDWRLPRTGFDTLAAFTSWHWLDPSALAGLRLPSAGAVASVVDEVDDCALFLSVGRRRYSRDVTPSTRTYLELLGTYSGHVAMPKEARTALLRCIGDLIDARYGGTITKRYLFELRVTMRTGSR